MDRETSLFSKKNDFESEHGFKFYFLFVGYIFLGSFVNYYKMISFLLNYADMFKDKTIVFTSGTFDMFHYNHLRMINYARALADILIVGVSTDELVMSYKDRPVIPFHERLQIIEALKTPDIVIPQHTLDHTEIVQKLNIDAFVVGDDWWGKYDYLKDLEVDVFYFPYGVGVSSTNIKKSIHDSYEKKLKSQQETKPQSVKDPKLIGK